LFGVVRGAVRRCAGAPLARGCNWLCLSNHG
jgi:hypothetical protein